MRSRAKRADLYWPTHVVDASCLHRKSRNTGLLAVERGNLAGMAAQRMSDCPDGQRNGGEEQGGSDCRDHFRIFQTCLLRYRPVDNMWNGCWFRSILRLVELNQRFTDDFCSVPQTFRAVKLEVSILFHIYRLPRRQWPDNGPHHSTWDAPYPVPAPALEAGSSVLQRPRGITGKEKDYGDPCRHATAID